MPRVILLIPYFGKWPFWMPFFLRSCGANPTINWIFFTDCGVPTNAPDNVKFHHYSFADYCQLVSSRLAIEFNPASAYKLCDIKPALGYVHADVVSEFDFWGFSDIDLIYGDLRNYFDVARLSKHDFLSTHERRVSGHLCLMRNTSRMREAFMAVPGWRELFAQTKHVAFDEKAFSRLFIRRKNWPPLLRHFINRRNHWYPCSQFKEAYSTPNGHIAWHDGSRVFPTRWIWSNGQLRNNLDGEREFPYFHFMRWKCEDWPALHEKSLSPDTALAERTAWCITADGFRKE